MIYASLGVFGLALILAIGLSLGLSLPPFKGRDALNHAPLIDG